MNKNLKKVTHNVDLCIVGGGMSGMCAAIAAARHGLKVVLMHDRPMFGGNASSEIRMWICGAHGENNRETGIIEEIILENIYRNPYRNWPIWDTVLFEKIKSEPNITPILNCSCNDAEMDGDKIVSISGWQTTTQLWHTVTADYFADCSGDSILAPLTGAEFRVGREASSEFDESLAPETADRKTMGLSCLMQGREMPQKRGFIPSPWAHKFTKEQLEKINKFPTVEPLDNYWALELGGENDSIHDTEELRDELLKIALGMWDYLKNDSGIKDAENYDLDFLGFLPGKRESRRYVGDYVMTQNDVRAEGKFDDLIAYGGWSMDDHNPGGFYSEEPPTIFHDAPSPFGIPYRCIYSKNISNLFFAGRNISVTHMALSSTRVMATCATLGQALGTAAAIASQHKTTPRGVYEKYIDLLKQTLMDDDCYLPFNEHKVSDITSNAKITSTGANAELLRNGNERKIGDTDNCWVGKPGDTITFTFDKPEKIHEIRFVFDSDLNRRTTCPDGIPGVHEHPMLCHVPLDNPPQNVPATLVKNLKTEVLTKDGKWTPAAEIKDNHMRLVKQKTDAETTAVRFTLTETNGLDTVGIYSIDLR